MRRFVMMTSCIILGTTITLLGSPVAQADNASFVREAKALGLPQASANLISTGRSACYFFSRNRDPGQITERVMRYLNVDSGVANQFLVLSVNEYCPQYGERIGV